MATTTSGSISRRCGMSATAGDDGPGVWRRMVELAAGRLAGLHAPLGRRGGQCSGTTCPERMKTSVVVTRRSSIARSRATAAR